MAIDLPVDFPVIDANRPFDPGKSYQPRGSHFSGDACVCPVRAGGPLVVAELNVVSGPDEGSAFVLDPREQAIAGRSRNCTIRLSDPRVSRQHARFECRGEEWWVFNLSTASGSLLNGAALEAEILESGDRLTLGETALSFTSGTQRPSAGSAAQNSDFGSIVLLRRFQSGDEKAAAEIFDRYTQRLVALARSRMSAKLAQRIDPEDIVQSAYRSFFRKASQEEGTQVATDHLWRLLAGITVHKVLGQVEFHTAGKRAMHAEQPLAAENSSQTPLMDRLTDREPSPAEAVALTDEVSRVLSEISPEERQIWELRLQGEELEAIALHVKKSTRTIRRVLDHLRQILERRLTACGATMI